MTDFVGVVLNANLAAGAAVLLVAAVRRPVRRAFGAEVAYGLWLAAPLAAVAGALPARTRLAAAAGTPHPAHAASGLLQAIGPALPLLWAVGAAVAAAALVWGQLRFLQRERAGAAGPAMVGVVSPRFVTPADYETRFTADERRIIRAHERTHLDRGDAHVNALIAAAQVLSWFNPLVHLAGRLARQDQELACDAAVLRRLPVARRRYAEALLKTQLGTCALPLGCYWPAPAPHPLEVRIGMLRAAAPTARRAVAGQLAVLALAVGAAGAAWAVKPPRPLPPPAVRVAPSPDPTMLFLIYRNPAVRPAA
jgi:beta-lactamase regulating signal transducer with metallopeptidase domain